jgi:indolepyruvate decarboxylase
MTAIKQTQKTVGQYLLDRLGELGVEHIFGVPGDYVLKMDKLIEESELQFVNTASENAAGYMADAYARLRGLGVACITYGVGISITNAIAQAYVESSPLVIISGTIGTNEFKPHYFMHHLINKSLFTHEDTTQLEIFKQVTVDQGILDNPKTAMHIIDRVLDACLSSQKPVYLEIPRNLVDAPVPDGEATISYDYPPSDPESLREALRETQELFAKCTQPLIWAGHEILRFDLSEPLQQFAEKNQIPVASSLLGKTVIDERHPLSLGVYQGEMSPSYIAEYVQACDCVLIAGVIMDDLDTGIFTDKIHPHKRIFATNRSVTISHHHFQDVRLEDYINGLLKIDLPGRTIGKLPNQNRFAANFTPVKDAALTTKRTFECIQSHINENNIIVTDVGDCLFAGADLKLAYNSFLACPYFASLGFGTPGAVGAQFAEPNRRVIAIVGDGGFQITAMELSAAVRYQLDPIVIILNNHGYGTERLLLEGRYNDVLNWNYTEIPKVLGGGIGIKAETEEALNNALDQALQKRGDLYIIEVELGKLDFSPGLSRLGEFLSHIVQAKSEKSH